MIKKIIKYKDKFRKIILTSILDFVLCFMLFIYEPIIAYSSNINDYWFNFKDMIVNNIILFLIVFSIIFLFNLLFYFISKKLDKPFIYNLYIIIFFVGFIDIYIQGNYLAGSLPTLDGSPILWNNYINQNIISILFLVLVILVNIILYRKFNAKYDKIVFYSSLLVFAMIFVSLISTLFTNKEIYVEKGNYASTNENINVLSSNKNFLVLLIDCVDSKKFDEVIKENDKENIFKDFTYYPDTLSTYGFTRDSIPFIFSGIWYEAQVPYSKYYLQAFDDSKLFNMLKKQKYDLNIYDDELQILNNDKYDVKNIKIVNSKINFLSFVKQEVKYVLFKYLPFPLKKYSSIESMDYNKCKINVDNDNTLFNWSDQKYYDLLDNIELQENNYFQFVHIEGGHLPYDLNENVDTIENGTYDDKLLATITIIDKYLTRIKESDQYNNSVIIILSDHGFNDYESVGRQNPALYIKGINEYHDKMLISDKKVSYVDLNDSIYQDLLNGKKSFELLSDIDDTRIRRYLYYKDYDKRIEQTLDGHAWETDKLKSTGVRYER